MAFLPIVTYGRDVLKNPTRPVEEITDEVRTLAADMIETMYATNGLGLAATQVGRDVSMFVVNGPAAFEDGDETSDRPDLVAVNPVVSNKTGKYTGEEGCLSVPGIRLDVQRAEELDLEYTDLDGERHRLHASGLLAIVIQHETDHLNGMLIVDKIGTLKKQLIKKQLKELEAQAE